MIHYMFQVILVFVVSGIADARQEKIKPNFSSSTLEYSSIFGFDPFTPFPELQTTTEPSKISTSTFTKPKKSAESSSSSVQMMTKKPLMFRKNFVKLSNRKSCPSIKAWVNSIKNRTTKRRSKIIIRKQKTPEKSSATEKPTKSKKIYMEMF